MRLSELIHDGEAFGKLLDMEIGAPRANADEVRDGDLYIIPKNGKSAYREPAGRPAAVVVGELVDLPEGCGEVIRAVNVRRLTAFIFARYYGVERMSATVIGVTGTAGKTTTARMIEEIFRADGRRVAFIGTGRVAIDGVEISNKYYSMTTPDPWYLYRILAEAEEAKCDAVVMEVSSHSLALHKVDPIKFRLGIFTNLSPEHLDFHGDMESYFAAKMRLSELSERMIFCLDDAYGRRGARLTNGVGVGVLWDGDYRATVVRDRGLRGSKYLFRAKNFSFIQTLPLPGVYNIYNAILATAATAMLGVRPCIARKCLADFSLPLGRYEIIKDEITVIIDYAHTASALENLLKSINSYKKARQRLTVVFGAGGERDRAKRPAMGRIAEALADFAIITDDNPRGEDPKEITAEIAAGFGGEGYEIINDRAEAITRAILAAREGDLVAIVGKGAERYMIDGGGYRDFDERAIISAALLRRKRNEN